MNDIALENYSNITFMLNILYHGSKKSFLPKSFCEKFMNSLFKPFSSFFLSFNMILYFTYHSGQLQHDQKVIRHTWKSRIVRWCCTPLANKLFVLSHKISWIQEETGLTVIQKCTKRKLSKNATKPVRFSLSVKLINLYQEN